MRSTTRYLTPLFAAAGTAMLFAPVAAAVPECTNTGPTTTQCETNGSTQIITSPPAMNYNPWFGTPFGGIVFGIGW
ncbi:hypothetical protein [Mycobacterium hubeiense]|uniref:hypothetical protein n=1 Tax=Mycobacterium hubeiense TaxID=1867256 RepID=UPI000C7F4E72|nr:hypothetical protein [Mycobacterium sp. QGD 101]